MIVYTAIIGRDTDDLIDPINTAPDWEYVCFTDQNLRSNVWQIRRVECPLLWTPRMFSREFKIAAWPIWREHACSLWVDADLQLMNSPSGLLSLMGDADMLTFRHPHRRTIEEEGDQVVRLKMASPESIAIQTARYRRHWTRQEFLTAPGIMLRRHTSRVRDFCDSWWSEYLGQGHERDQLSVDYCLWKHQIHVQYLRGSYLTSPFVRWRYRQNERKHQHHYSHG